MKRICVPLAVSLLLATVAPAQEAAPPLCTTFEGAEARGLMMEDLMARHIAAYVPDSDDCAFPDQRVETQGAMMDLRTEIGEILDKVGVGEGMVFLQVFYDSDGRIQRVLVRGVDDDAIPGVCARIERLAGTYRYPIAASRPFYNCVTIRRR